MPRAVGYVALRILVACLLVFFVSSGALLLARLAPGDVTSEMVGRGISAERITIERARLGLNRSFRDQYAEWLRRSIRLDLGTSFRYGRPVRDLIGERARNTAWLGAIALLLATCVGLPLGVISGSRPSGAVTALIRGASVLVLSFPPLILSLILALLAARTGWFPIGGMQSLGIEEMSWWTRGWDAAWHVTLPALALALPLAATLERLQSQAMAEAIQEPFVHAARARGIPPRLLVWRHALRPALKPVAAVYGIVIGSLLSGSFAVEIVLSWPGLGRLTYEALVARDIYLVAGCAAAGSLFLAGGSLLSDFMLVAAEPRLRRRE